MELLGGWGRQYARILTSNVYDTNNSKMGIGKEEKSNVLQKQHDLDLAEQEVVGNIISNIEDVSDAILAELIPVLCIPA